MVNVVIIFIIYTYTIIIFNFWLNKEFKINHIIFGIMAHLEYNQSKYFFLSLQRIKYKGKIIIFIDKKEDIYRYSNLSIDYIIFKNAYPYYPINSYKYPIKESFIKCTFPELLRIQKYNTFIWILRYYLIFAFIKFYGSYNDIYLLSDIKDVIFQKDPFKWKYKKGVYLVEESKIINLKKLGWMKKYRANEKILNNSILNGGIIFGSANDIKLFLGEYLNGYKKEGKFGEDQAYMNYFYYSKGKFNFPIYICESNKCFAKCLVQEIRYTVDMIINKSDYMIYNKDGSLPALIHQYTYAFNKPPSIRKKLFEEYRIKRSFSS